MGETKSILCPPIFPFISDGVAAWQSSGNAERNSESIRDLMSVRYFANRGKVGNGQWLPAGDYWRPGVSSSFIQMCKDIDQYMLQMFCQILVASPTAAGALPKQHESATFADHAGHAVAVGLGRAGTA
jgi:hypothetical protein